LNVIDVLVLPDRIDVPVYMISGGHGVRKSDYEQIERLKTGFLSDPHHFWKHSDLRGTQTGVGLSRPATTIEALENTMGETGTLFIKKMPHCTE